MNETKHTINMNLEINEKEIMIMPNATNEITTGKKTIGNFTVEYQKNGYGGCIPVIDGQPQPSLMFGYATESDRAACMKLIEDALRATGNNIPAIQHYIMTAVRTAANNVHPDEAVEVNGQEILISYTDKIAYLDTCEIANLADLTCELPPEAIKALLVARAETALNEIAMEEDDYDGDYED